MRRLKKNIFYGLFGGLAAVLFLIKTVKPDIAEPNSQCDSIASAVVEEVLVEEPLPQAVAEPEGKEERVLDTLQKHPVRGVYSYAECFPDLQEVQIVAARKWGVKPVKNRKAAEERKSELVYVGASPYYMVDKSMRRSIPYLVPRASSLLHDIGRNFLDSLYVKGVPLHRIIVSSVLRTEEDVAMLLKSNGNASDQSCHRFGTTIDIAYNRYSTVTPPGEPPRREVKNDTLKWVLSEVLRDMRAQGRCYVKHEVKQGCFHITVR